MKYHNATLIGLLLASLMLSLFAPRAVAQVETHADLAREDILGLALYPDGRTPVQHLPVRVWHEEAKKVIYKTRTGADGSFRVPYPDTGRVTLFIGRVRVNLNIVPGEESVFNQQHTIVVVMNRYALYGPHLRLEPVWAALLYDLYLATEMFEDPKPPLTVSP